MNNWFHDSHWLLAHKIQRFAFAMTMSVVLTLGAGMLAILLTELHATQRQANQEAVNVLGEALASDIGRRVESLRVLGSSSLAWTALTDSTGREAYLRPFLIARDKNQEGGPTQLLDYKGRHIMGTQTAYSDPPAVKALIASALQSKLTQGQVIQDDGGALLLVVEPILFPYSQEVIGVLTSTINLGKIFNRRVAGLSESLGVTLSHQGQALATAHPDDGDSFAPVGFDLHLPVHMDNGVLAVSLHSSNNPWLLPVLKLLAYFVVAGLALGALAWRVASMAAQHLTLRLNALALASEAVSAGNSNAIADDQSPDEIGILARTLSHSLQAYRNINQHLEQLVQDKTSELSASEQRFRGLFEKNALVMLLVDPESGSLLAANAAAAQFYGYEIATLERMHISDINCLSPAMLAKEMDMARQERRNYFQFTHRLCSGAMVPVEVHSTPIPTGEKVVLFSVVHDISERTKFEEQLKLSDLALKGISQGVLIADAHGVILSANSAFSTITGYANADIVGVSCRLLQGELTDPVAIQAIRSAIASAVEFHGEILNYRKDGSTFWNELTISPVFDVDGAVCNYIGIARDVTGRKLAEDKVQLAANVFTHAREGIMITSSDGTILETNKAFSLITGYSREEVAGKKPSMLSSQRHDKDFYAEMWQALLDKGHWYGEVWNRRKDGVLYVEMLNISAVRNARGAIENFVALFSDITALKDHEHQLERIAHFDALTGLANRVLLADRLNIAMVQAQRRSQQLAVVYLDLDGFKAVNDMHGHAVGDKLLVAISKRMKQALRDGDTLARIGGDEFIAVLTDLHDFATSVPVISRLLNAAALPFELGDVQVHVSASLGVSFYPQRADVDADQLMRQADQAMYQAKLAGKNRYHVYNAAQDQSVRSLHAALDDIRRGLNQLEFVLHYQPKVHMGSGAIAGMEALIRWQHPERGLLMPAEFLPSIEGHALAIDVGEWVIHTALAQTQAWQDMGIDLPVSVNIGAGQLQQPDFLARLRAALDRYPLLRAPCLEIEILESSALHDFAGVSNLIDQCRQLGVLFALDDFGTGYSSMTYVKRLDFARLKIDQSFVRGMHENPHDSAILQAVIGLASALRREVIAEGVETVAQGVRLLELGCAHGQGYGIARPMAPDLVPAWTRTWRPHAPWLEAGQADATRPTPSTLADQFQSF